MITDQLYHIKNILVRKLSRDQKIHNCPFCQIKSLILKNFKENFKFYKSSSSQQCNSDTDFIETSDTDLIGSLQKGASHRNFIQTEDQTNSPEVHQMGQDTSHPDI